MCTARARYGGSNKSGLLSRLDLGHAAGLRSDGGGSLLEKKPSAGVSLGLGRSA